MHKRGLARSSHAPLERLDAAAQTFDDSPVGRAGRICHREGGTGSGSATRAGPGVTGRRNVGYDVGCDRLGPRGGRQRRGRWVSVRQSGSHGCSCSHRCSCGHGCSHGGQRARDRKLNRNHKFLISSIACAPNGQEQKETRTLANGARRPSGPLPLLLSGAPPHGRGTKSCRSATLSAKHAPKPSSLATLVRPAIAR